VTKATDWAAWVVLGLVGLFAIETAVSLASAPPTTEIVEFLIVRSTGATWWLVTLAPLGLAALCLGAGPIPSDVEPRASARVPLTLAVCLLPLVAPTWFWASGWTLVEASRPWPSRIAGDFAERAVAAVGFTGAALLYAAACGLPAAWRRWARPGSGWLLAGAIGGCLVAAAYVLRGPAVALAGGMSVLGSGSAPQWLAGRIAWAAYALPPLLAAAGCLWAWFAPRPGPEGVEVGSPETPQATARQVAVFWALGSTIVGMLWAHHALQCDVESEWGPNWGSWGSELVQQVTVVATSVCAIGALVALLALGSRDWARHVVLGVGLAQLAFALALRTELTRALWMNSNWAHPLASGHILIPWAGLGVTTGWVWWTWSPERDPR
jgi:hypothetical protein